MNLRTKFAVLCLSGILVNESSLFYAQSEVGAVNLPTFTIAAIYDHSRDNLFQEIPQGNLSVRMTSYDVSSGSINITLVLTNPTGDLYLYFGGNQLDDAVELGFGGGDILTEKPENRSVQIATTSVGERFRPIILDKYRLDLGMRVDKVILSIPVDSLRRSLELSGVQLGSEIKLKPFVCFVSLANYKKLDVDRGIYETIITKISANESVVLSVDDIHEISSFLKMRE